MPIPNYQKIMLPILKLLNDGKERSLNEIEEYIESFFKLTDEEKKKLLPSGKQAIIRNREGWARTYLKKAGLLESPTRASFKITQRGP
jgi:restriction system protein